MYVKRGGIAFMTGVFLAGLAIAGTPNNAKAAPNENKKQRPFLGWDFADACQSVDKNGKQRAEMKQGSPCRFFNRYLPTQEGKKEYETWDVDEDEEWDKDEIFDDGHRKYLITYLSGTCQPHEGKDPKGGKFTDLYCMPAGTLNQRSKVDDPSTGGTTSGDMSSGNPPSEEKPPGGSSGNKEDRPYVE